MNKLPLFSGIGGDDLASEWAGIDTICFVERDKYCQKVLKKHWPDIPIIEDVKDVTKEKIQTIIANTSTVRFNTGRTEQSLQGLGESGSALSGRTGIVDIIAGGFPCQPHSVAGKRKGSSDERNLWPEFRRIIGEIKPRWVVAENVPGLFSSDAGRFFGEVLADLAALGYAVGWCTYGAVDVGALHRRNRVFIVAYSEHNGRASGQIPGSIGEGSDYSQTGQNATGELARPSEQSGIMAHAAGIGSETGIPEQAQRQEGNTGELINSSSQCSDVSNPNGEQCDTRLRAVPEFDPGYWAVEPNVGRVANEIPPKLDGGRLNEQMDNQEANTEDYYACWEILRDMWLNKEFTKTPPQLRGREIPNIMQKLPYHNGPITWHPPKKENKELFSMWERVSALPFQEAQYLLPELLNLIGALQLNEAMAPECKEPDIPRVATGIKDRVNRLKGLGNAVVPQQIYLIYKAIMEVEK